MKRSLITLFLLFITLSLICSCKWTEESTDGLPDGDALILCCEREISDYVIVLPVNHNIHEKNIAFFLKNHLFESFGYRLEIVTDDSEHQWEILIGNTCRSNIQNENGCFFVSAENDKLTLSACDVRGYEGLYDYIKHELFNKSANAPIVLEKGTRILKKAESIMEDGTVLSEESYGDVRTAYYNIYSGSNNNATPDVRQPFQKEIIRQYAPDVIGFQEFSSKYHDDFSPMLADLGYTMIPTSRGRSNCTPIFYKSQRLELVDSGHYLYKDTGDYSKSISWAVFREKTTEKLFAFFNTHFMFRREGIDANEVRISNASEALEKFISVQEKYPGIPMILGGDFNCRISSDPHKVLTNGGLLSAWELADHKNDSKGHHMHSTFDKELGIFSHWNKITTAYSTAIDHAYVNKNTKVGVFSTVISYYTLWCSDHMPLFLDIDLV